MYLSFFNLREPPFNLTPDPRFLFLSPQHEEALSHLLYGVYERKGFIEITGEVGMGKTVLCRALLDRLDEKTSTALIFNSYLTKIELLQAIANDFGLTPRETTNTGYIDVLNTYLLDEFSAGHNAVVLIDEAQNLEPTVLEQLRMLSNLETERGKLLQVILVGQPELRARLSAPNMRQLDQRIAVRFHLHELTRSETTQYITHRMSVAGAANAVTFTRRARNLIYQYSQGLPRRINLVCDRALMTAFVGETRRITGAIVRRSITDLSAPIRPAHTTRPQWQFLKGMLLGSMACLSVVALCGASLLFPGVRERLPAPLMARVQALLPRPVSPPSALPPVQLPPLPVAETVAAPAPPAAVPTPPVAPVSASSAPPPPVSSAPAVAALEPERLKPVAMELAQTLWRLKVETESQLLPSQAVRLASWEGWALSVARAMGLDVLSLQASIWQLQAISRPCLVEMRPEPTAPPELWVLVQGRPDNVLIYQEPAGLTSVSLRQLRQMWSGKLYLTSEAGSYRGVTLRQGMFSERVRDLQQALYVRGYLNDPPSGQFDAQTYQAVRRFQRDNQLIVDGQAGRQTLMMLLHFGAHSSERTT